MATKTVLEQILKASNNYPQPLNDPLKYPFPLSTQPIFSTLKPNLDTPFTHLIPLTGSQLSESDTLLIGINSQVFRGLRRKLISQHHPLSSNSFFLILNTFLEKIGDIKFGGFVGDDADSGGEGYCCELIRKYGSFIGRDVMEIVIQCCVHLGIWEVLKVLIVNNFVVDHDLRSILVSGLVGKERFDLICLCLRCFSDIGALDLGRVLKCFLSASRDGSGDGKLCVDVVWKEWESEASASIEKVIDMKVTGEKLRVAKEAALLLMIAYDEFSSFELCLHFVFSSSTVDEVVFPSALGKLNAEEMLRLLRYLGKWLRKYERFPQAGPCPKAGSMLELKLCHWVPRFEDVVKALGLVVDEHFSSLALHSEFHEQLKAVDGVVSSLVSEGRLSSPLANLIEILKPEVGGA